MTKLKIRANYKLETDEELATVPKILFTGNDNTLPGSLTLSENSSNFNYFIVVAGASESESGTFVVLARTGRFKYESISSYWLIFNYTLSGTTFNYSISQTQGFSNAQGHIYKIIGCK